MGTIKCCGKTDVLGAQLIVLLLHPLVVKDALVHNECAGRTSWDPRPAHLSLTTNPVIISFSNIIQIIYPRMYIDHANWDWKTTSCVIFAILQLSVGNTWRRKAGPGWSRLKVMHQLRKHLILRLRSRCSWVWRAWCGLLSLGRT